MRGPRPEGSAPAQMAHISYLRLQQPSTPLSSLLAHGVRAGAARCQRRSQSGIWAVPQALWQALVNATDHARVATRRELKRPFYQRTISVSLHVVKAISCK